MSQQQISKITKRNLSQDLLTIENTDSDLKVHALHYANELLERLRLPFEKLLKTRSICRNNTKLMFGKRNGAYSLSIRVQTTINTENTFPLLTSTLCLPPPPFTVCYMSYDFAYPIYDLSKLPSSHR